MPAPASAQELLELGFRSRLLDPQAVSEFRQRHGASELAHTPKQLAENLVRDGLLTPFQADRLLVGKWRGFIINGKYRLLSRIGAGGMGSVYLCEHMFMRRRVALKVLPLKQAEDPESLELFRREARAVGCLDHPNIVRAHDVDHEGNVHFLVLEHIDGTNLYDLVRRHGPLSVERAAHYIRQAALGLQHAHEAGLVHRDIKPGNLLLDRAGVIKVLDMGLVRFFNEPEENLSADQEHGNVLGTADYLAPEQVNDSRVDIRADIYSLGVTLYYLLAGKSPFHQGTVAQKLIWHQVRRPKPIRSLRADVPEEMEQVLARMLAKQPGQRYQAPAEVAAALLPWTQTPIPLPHEEEMPPPAWRTGPASTAATARNSLSPRSTHLSHGVPLAHSSMETVQDKAGNTATPRPPEQARPAPLEIPPAAKSGT